MKYYRWYCKDLRYQIQSGTSTPVEYISATCSWYTNFTINPSNLTCVLKFCTNATKAPLTDSRNYGSALKRTRQKYNFIAGERITIGSYVDYICKDGLRFPADVDYKEKADNSTKVYCKDDGTFNYPNPWSPCISNIQCVDPGETEEVEKSEIVGSNRTYKSQLEYKCKDKRKWIKHGATSTAVASRRYECLWKKQYNVVANDLSCELHHCGHPNKEHGSHPAPPDKYDISLVETDETKKHHVPYGSNVVYKCNEGHFIENNEIDPTKTNIKVQCMAGEGTYNVPQSWPNCTETVNCGPHPKPPEGGSIVWLNGTSNKVVDEFSNSSISYCLRFYLTILKK